MAAFPVDLAALLAHPELLIVFPNERRKLFDDCLFLNAYERYVALEAAREGIHGRLEVKPLNDFPDLTIHLFRPNTVAVGDNPSLQQPPVSCENNPLFCHSNIDKLLIFIIVRVESVESEHAQGAGKLSEMHIEDEAEVSQWLASNLRYVLNVKGLEYRIHADAVTGFQLT